MPKNLTAWAADVATRRVDLTGNSIVPTFYVSKTAPDSAALSAQASKELANGWPAPIVSAAGDRRLNQAQFWTTALGVSVGPRPPMDLIGPDAAQALTTVLRRHPRAYGIPVYPGDGAPSEKMLEWVNAWHAYNDYTFHDPAGATLLAKQLTNLGYVSLGCTLYNGPGVALGLDAGISTTLKGLVDAETDENVLYVGVYVWSLDPADHATQMSSLAVTKFLKPAGVLKGVHGLYYASRIGNTSWVNARTFNHSHGFELVGILAEEGFVEAGNAWQTDRTLVWEVGGLPTYSIRSSIEPASSHVVYVVKSRAATFGPWNSAHAPYYVANGMSKDSVYHIGDPEFATQFTALGAVATTSNVITVAAADLHVEWPGTKLSTLANLSGTDKAKIDRLLVSSVVHATPPVAPIRLIDTLAEQLYQENGETMKFEILVPAEPAQGVSAINYDAAVAKANLLDRRIFHRLVEGTQAWETPDMLKITGAAGSPAIDAYIDDVAQGWDANRCLAWIAAGIYVQVEYGGQNPYFDLYGFELAEIMTAEDGVKAQLDFSESTAFGRGLPVLANVSLSRRTCMWLLQAAQKRDQFTNYLVASCLMGTQARRELI